MQKGWESPSQAFCPGLDYPGFPKEARVLVKGAGTGGRALYKVCFVWGEFAKEKVERKGRSTRGLGGRVRENQYVPKFKWCLKT